MKNLKLLLIAISTMLSLYSKASHASGGYFEYACLGNSQYRVTFYFLRHCAGSMYADTVGFNIFNSCSTPCGSWKVIAPVVSVENAQYGCNSGCDNGTNMAPNFQFVKYETLVTLPYPCSDWTIGATVSARQIPDFGDFPGMGYTYYNYCKINNTNNLCRSSPTITGYPITLGCANNTGKSLYDIHPNTGVSTSYSMAVPLSGDCSNVLPYSYESVTSVNRPVPALADFTIGTNGSLTYYPTTVGVGFFAIRIVETIGSTVVGEQVIDGVSYTSNSSQCGLGSGVEFSDFLGEGGNLVYVGGVDHEYCKSLLLTAVNNGEDVVNVSVQAPDYGSYDITINPDGTASVELCVKFPVETLCQEVDAAFIVNASTTNVPCLSYITGSGHKGYYHIVKEKGKYCPTNIYITNRSPLTNPVPVFSRAQDTIWIGNKMPLTAPQTILGNVGPVAIDQPATFVAGREVIIPSCVGGGSNCITMNAGTTIYIRPNSCSDSCEQVPIGLWVMEKFRCSAEELVAFPEGEAPFSYKWDVNGTVVNNASNTLNVHDVVSTTNGGAIPYTVTVTDAVGAVGSFSGELMGTRRFYEDIRDNTTYYPFPEDAFGNPTTIFGKAGNYYGASIYCVEQHPSYIFDAVNAGPPWYGATEMDFTVFGRWGQQIHNFHRNLEGGDDWSFDNGEIYWNGHYNNDMNDSCAMSVINVVAYKLTAKNCYVQQHVEAASISFIDGVNTPGCTRQDSLDYYMGTIDVAKSMTHSGGNDGGQFNNGRFHDRQFSSDVIAGDLFIICVPNPAQTSFVVQSNQMYFINVRLIDRSGKVLKEFPTLEVGEQVDVSRLSPGIYILDIGGHHIKLLKN